MLLMIAQETSNPEKVEGPGWGEKSFFLFILKVKFNSSFHVALVATMFWKNI